MAVDYYYEYICRRVDLDLDELAGKDLACWCSLDQPCHADVLIELANGRKTMFATDKLDGAVFDSND